MVDDETSGPAEPQIEETGEVKVPVEENNNANLNRKRKAELQRIEPCPSKGLKCLANRNKTIALLNVKKQVSTDNRFSEAVNKLHEIVQSAAGAIKQDDMYDSFGKYIASLLRSMNNQSEAVKIQQEITSVVFKKMHSSNDIPCASTSNYSSYSPSTHDDTTRIE